MKLDNEELMTQRTKLLLQIRNLVGHLEILKENINYVFSMKNFPGVFFRIKDIIYIITTENLGRSSKAAVLDLFKDELDAVIMFTPLDDDASIDYYATDEGKEEALNAFETYILNNVGVILHELVHFDDRKNGILQSDDKSVNSNPYAYYNHPAEIRAYTQEFLYTAINEISEAINNNEITTKAELKNFTKIYKKYKDIFTKHKLKNAFVYWKPATFKDYLENLNFIIDLIGTNLP